LKITKLQYQIKNPERVSVYIDNLYSFSLSVDEMLSFGLKKGLDVSEADLLAYKKTSQFGRHVFMLLRYLAFRERSEKELRDYFIRKKIEPEEAQELINYAKTRNLVNDERFAKMWAENRLQLKLRSKRLIAQELQSKGISPDIIRRTVDGLIEKDSDSLKKVIDKKRRQARYQDRNKLIAFLQRQGFSYADIQRELAFYNQADDF
jgi:regulatory protein